MRKLMTLIMVIMIASLCSCSSKTAKSTGQLQDISVIVDYILYDYQELKEQAPLIVKAKITDELSEENTVTEQDPDDPDAIIEAYSLRNIEIMEVYKSDPLNKITKGSELSVIEMAAVSGNQYIHLDGYKKMEQGGVYILFLNNDTKSGDYSIISANNGKVDLENIEESEFYDIAVKSVIEYDSELSGAEKKRIINSEIAKKDSKETGPHIKTFDIPEDKLTINYYIDSNENRTYISIVRQ